MSLFAHLPAELIRTFLDTLDPTSFYICLQTSKLFRQHAVASTKLLRDQLARIPGQRILSAHMANDADALLELFSIRAVQHLACGVEWMADRKMWCTSEGKKVDRKTSQLVLWGTRNMPGEKIVLLEVMADAIVNVYVILDEEGEIRYNSNSKKEKKTSRREFVPRLKHTISPYGLSNYLPDCRVHGGEYEVVKVAQCPFTPLAGERGAEDGDLMVGVLYRMKRSSCKCNKNMKLLVFRLDRSCGPIVVESFDIVEPMMDVVVAMGLTRINEAILVVTHGQLDDYSLVTTYRTEEDENSLERRTFASCRAVNISIPHERVSSISISGPIVHLYPTSFPMPHWTIPRLPINFPETGETIERRDLVLPDISGVFRKHSLGRAIACHHHHIDPQDPDLTAPICINTALELVISQEDCITGSRKGAFLLKAVQYLPYCEDFELDNDYAHLDHIFVAELADLPRLDQLSTLGLIVAVSHRAHRIAIASWRTLKVWSLDPQAFLDPEYSLGGGEGVPGDYLFMEGCGWQYYSSESIDRDCVMLHPVELPNSAVIFSLEFRGEDELWGWTEAGLCRWKFGPIGNGRREEGLLEGI